METKSPQTPDSGSEWPHERQGPADSDSQWPTETEEQSDTEPEWDDSWDREAESEPEAVHNLRFPDFIQFYECLPASRYSQVCNRQLLTLHPVSTIFAFLACQAIDYHPTLYFESCSLTFYPLCRGFQPGIEKGDKNKLRSLIDLQVGYPMMFSLWNPNSTQETHCGVLELSAPEGIAFLPQWMMKNLQLKEGERVRVSKATLPKGTYIKLKPHTSDFLDITNPGAMLEVALRWYTCLTVGDTLVLPYGNNEFRIDVVEARPEGGVSIIDTDCEVDFAQAHDYDEPPKPATAVSFSSTRPQEKGSN
uniref:Ubiquitin fusion degradation protein 1 n=1 Tax=Kalanchoe fedtschenkoi TaxID=63787 RepID=A0A7N1A2G1_KALFE